MKRLSLTEALNRLEKIKTIYRNNIFFNYETKAKSCSDCDTQGVCCSDAHFVNVHITQLESESMRLVLKNLDAFKRETIRQNILQTIEDYQLKETGDTFEQTYSCPLFEKGVGCLVHSVKPSACIQHACYELQEDLPPDELQEQIENKIERLNHQTYGNNRWLPLPVWMKKISL